MKVYVVFSQHGSVDNAFASPGKYAYRTKEEAIEASHNLFLDEVDGIRTNVDFADIHYADFGDGSYLMQYGNQQLWTMVVDFDLI